MSADKGPETDARATKSFASSLFGIARSRTAATRARSAVCPVMGAKTSFAGLAAMSCCAEISACDSNGARRASCGQMCRVRRLIWQV